MRLVFRYRKHETRRDGTPLAYEPDIYESVTWPEGWRIPVAGELVQLPSGYSGTVEYVSWLADGAEDPADEPEIQVACR